MASEEMELPHAIPNRYPQGEYLLLFDPLDGSSNIDINVSVGTIFSVLRCAEGDDPTQPKAFLQPGTQQLAAGYAVYGPTTLLVLTVGDGVACFTLDREQGSFVLTQENMQIPADTREFAINMSNMRHWEAPVRRYVEEMPGGQGPARAARISTCAGWPRWWPTCIASSVAAASSCIRSTARCAPRAASCA